MTAVPLPDVLIFVRHGQTDWNAEGRMQGQQDIPLNDTGRAQARRNGAALAAFLRAEALSVGDFRFLASPLGRTRETMELLRAEMGLPPQDYGLDDRLKELTFGAWEGYTLEELAGRTPDLVAARKADKWGFVAPGGESYGMLSVRIGGWLRSVDGPSVVVTHGGVIRVLHGLLLAVPPAEVPKLDVPQDTVWIWRHGSLTRI
ncbi:histidine phosphatase family protein [Polymorphum gilvum]|uniref:Phosphoglycerate mutase family protein n=1 Tax=Polymorphum gilvum (strain LMG 25793 / CGMCC 1.9160 / SL003B-26A1) TaxID=991905 RepID=F2IYC6_POLGS|nr:histidine phosphatase family protein [Polymorphum gilvum]ADZ71738.1 Phosphoglycerate mutase family protein [Polymorphum gilvum SL003B-26A1]